MKIISIVLFVLMLFLTLLGFFQSFSNFIFAGGSDGLMSIVDASVWIKIFFLFLFGFLLYKKIGFKFLYLFPILILFWFICGRTIGIFPDGRISTGWFYIETNRINICNENDDCENIIHYKTKIEKLTFFRLKIKTEKTNEIIFVGPFVWSKALKTFNSVYTPDGSDMSTQR